jgi:hypothetical protein
MAVSKMFQRVVQYISEAVVRIFGPNDDAYPNSGVQPFDGEVKKENKKEF